MKDTEKLNSSTTFKVGDVAGGNYIAFTHDSNPKVISSGVLQGTLSSPFPKTSQTILFLFAHPDDEQYMAGTIQKFITNGHNVYVAYTTSGQNGTDVRGILLSGSIELRDAREAEAYTSLQSLGVDVNNNLYALRGDAVSTDITIITTELANRLSNDGVEPDVIFTFDNTGIYGNLEHKVCQRVAIEYYRLTDFIKSVYFFCIPESDIDTTVVEGDITDVGAGSNAINDGLVDWHYKLSTLENTAKKNILEIHVTQYIDPQKSQIQDHYNKRPFEYFMFGYGKLNTQDNYTQTDYIKMLFRQ